MSPENTEQSNCLAPARVTGYTGYKNYGCRCPRCKADYSARQSELKKRGRSEGARWVERDRARHAERMRERRAAGEAI